MFLAFDVEISDSDLGILKNRTEELFARPQLFLSPLTLCDINYRNDGPSDRSALKNWKRGIFNRDRGAILSPDQFRVDAAALSLLERTVDGTFIALGKPSRLAYGDGSDRAFSGPRPPRVGSRLIHR